MDAPGIAPRIMIAADNERIVLDNLSKACPLVIIFANVVIPIKAINQLVILPKKTLTLPISTSAALIFFAAVANDRSDIGKELSSQLRPTNCAGLIFRQPFSTTVSTPMVTAISAKAAPTVKRDHGSTNLNIINAPTNVAIDAANPTSIIPKAARLTALEIILANPRIALPIPEKDLAALPISLFVLAFINLDKPYIKAKSDTVHLANASASTEANATTETASIAIASEHFTNASAFIDVAAAFIALDIDFIVSENVPSNVSLKSLPKPISFSICFLNVIMNAVIAPINPTSPTNFQSIPNKVSCTSEPNFLIELPALSNCDLGSNPVIAVIND